MALSIVDVPQVYQRTDGHIKMTLRKGIVLFRQAEDFLRLRGNLHPFFSCSLGQAVQVAALLLHA